MQAGLIVSIVELKKKQVNLIVIGTIHRNFEKTIKIIALFFRLYCLNEF